jgi:hypothetical protein
LRFVASRYEGLIPQASKAEQEILQVIRRLEDIRARNWAKHQPLSRNIPDEHVHLTLTDNQSRALRYLAAEDGRQGAARPSKACLAELAHGGLARKSGTVSGYSITKRGRTAHGHLLWDDIL